jgi:lipopolysaccharide biosynthesis protein
MIAPDYWPVIEKFAVWGPNRVAAEGLLARIGVDRFDLRGLAFPAGSMFWCRPQTLKPIFAFGMSFLDFPPEPIGGDGTLAHAVERLFFISCEIAGYRWKMITVPEGFLTPYRIYHPRFDNERRTRSAVETLTA